jgi:hypothetical protein
LDQSSTLAAQYNHNKSSQGAIVKRILTFALLTFSFAVANFAQAGQTVTYTFAGVADGSVGGSGFTGQSYVFTVTGDSGTAQNGPYPFSNVLTGGTIRISGTACSGGCTISNPGNYLVFNTGQPSLVHGISLVGFLDQPGSTLIEGCYYCGGTTVNDNLVYSVAPTPSGAENALHPYYTFATSGGDVQIANLDGHITYAVAGLAPVGIPTLSQWGLVLLSILLAMGAVISLRRRHR